MENKINSLYSNKASYLPNASYKLLEKINQNINLKIIIKVQDLLLALWVD